MPGPRFTKIKIDNMTGEIKSIYGEDEEKPNQKVKAVKMGPDDFKKIKKVAKDYLCTVYHYHNSPGCTVVIRSDGTAVKICH